jgi:hypothetical protein
MCQHGKRKSRCKDCGGSEFCEHGKNKHYCKKCGGSVFCDHGKHKRFCKDCDGASMCQHGKHISRCKDCGGSELCKAPLCETRGMSKYDGYCLRCCINLRPDIQVSRNYKTKENDVVSRITSYFKDFSWSADKVIKDGCSQFRPDLLLDLGSHVIIVEVDENKHSSYDCSCENKRLMSLSQDLAHRPIVFIRFNPDSYTNVMGVKISSCWRYNKQGIMTIVKTKENEWIQRIQTLKDEITYWSDNSCEKTIEIVELFY